MDLLKLFREGTQKYRILKYMLNNQGAIEVWRLIAPRPSGLGVAQYNARIKEIRAAIQPWGYYIDNDAGKSFKLRFDPKYGEVAAGDQVDAEVDQIIMDTGVRHINFY